MVPNGIGFALFLVVHAFVSPLPVFAKAGDLSNRHTYTERIYSRHAIDGLLGALAAAKLGEDEKTAKTNRYIAAVVRSFKPANVKVLRSPQVELTDPLKPPKLNFLASKKISPFPVSKKMEVDAEIHVTYDRCGKNREHDLVRMELDFSKARNDDLRRNVGKFVAEACAVPAPDGSLELQVSTWVTEGPDSGLGGDIIRGVIGDQSRPLIAAVVEGSENLSAVMIAGMLPEMLRMKNPQACTSCP